MSLLDNLKKPWVLYAGLGLGAVILLTSSKGGSAAPSQAQSLSYQDAMNQAGMTFMQHQFDVSTQFEAQRFAADIQMQAGVIAGLLNIANVGSTQANQTANTQAGIASQVIQNDFALTLDRQSQAMRMALVNVLGNDYFGASSSTDNPQIAEQNNGA